MTRTQRTLTLAVLSALVLSPFLPSSIRGGAPSSWIHMVSDASNPHVDQLRIQTVAAEDNHLVGSATYREKVRQLPVKIDGIETLDGRFWPNVVTEVTNDLDGEWKKLEQASNPGRPVSVTLKFYEANVMLYVNLDAFRPLIGQMRYGRVVLQNGFDTLFELNELLPDSSSGKTVEDDWDRRTLWGYLEDPLAKGAFFIDGMSVRDGHLGATAGYFDPEAVSATRIDGTETSDGEFWVSATLQVANDPDGEWQTIGPAATPGKAATITIETKGKKVGKLNVGVDILRPMANRFGYGRAVLSNGKAAAFELKDLLPPRAANTTKVDRR